MTDEVVVGSGKTLKVGDETFKIKDHGVPISFVDFFTEYRANNGMVSFATAHIVHDAGNEPEVVINTRMRMSLVTAQAMHGLLGDILEQALKPPVDKDKAH
ncbi:hypothetical protein [Phyllobacterium sophorae]|uniref:DUF3467 domain-containing protein n=1 Tax=Phyllobacterium sophorae TaxID=1520277 RepID=A0A2P7BDX0_9HYPH|nr:hypothetical protein [Phyllobacterium sophorae]PSH64677.1 hypothetical protein CU103_12400 [Phyllobacterium sophorae]